MPIDTPPFDVPPGYERRASGLITRSPQDLLKPRTGSILPGMMSTFALAAAGVAPVAISHTASNSGRLTSGSIVFSGQSIGAAASDRYVYVCIGLESNSRISSCTIGGVSATEVAGDIFDTNPSPDTNCAIYRRLVPSGTTVDIVVGTSGTSSDYVGIIVFRVVGGTGTVGIAQAYSNLGSMSFTTADGGGLICCAAINSNAGNPAFLGECNGS